MFRTNLKIAWRNFWKNRKYTLLNIAGLSVALTLFLTGLLYRTNEYGYEKWNPAHADIYRIDNEYDKKEIPLTPVPFVSAVRDLPITEAATAIRHMWPSQVLITHGEKQLYQQDVILADSGFFRVFPFPLVYGDGKTALSQPHSVVLTLSLSEALFGKGVDPVGQVIHIGEVPPVMVTGVVDRDRYPSHLYFSCIIQRSFQSADWFSNNVFTYMLGRPRTDPQHYETALGKLYTSKASSAIAMDTTLRFSTPAEVTQLIGDVSHRHYYFAPIDLIHLNSTVEYEWKGNGSGKYLDILLLIITIILIMAAINFTNMSIAYATRRAKETGLRKVMGARRDQLIFQFLAETFFQCLLAFVIALITAEILLPFLSAKLDMNIGGWNSRNWITLTTEVLASACIIALLAGGYPALVMSGYLPSQVLKGSFSEGLSGIALRKGLLILQFTTAAAFTSGILIIVQQTNYMRNMDLGYNASQVLAVHIQKSQTNDAFAFVKDRLASIPGVRAVGRSSQIPGENPGGNNYRYKGTDMASAFLSVDAGYCKAMGLQMKEGREFDGNHPGDTTGAIYVNESFAKAVGIAHVGETLDYGHRPLTVIGIVKDFHFGNPKAAIEPLAFQFLRGNPQQYVLLNIQSVRARAVLEHLQDIWKTVEPGYPVQYTFLDDHFEGLLKEEGRTGFLFGIFTAMALVLAVMGLVALAAYTAERKTKEISVRKILGASVGQILAMLNIGFFRSVLLANILAVPISWWVTRQWLQSFAYRIHASGWPFVVAALCSLGLSILVVTILSLKATLSSPVKALKYE